jgi:hypothetical protein
MDAAVLKRVLVNEAVKMSFKRTGHFARSSGARSIPQAVWPLLRKTLHPFSQGGVGKVEGLGDGVDVVASHNLTDGLRTAKDTGLFGLCEHGR